MEREEEVLLQSELEGLSGEGGGELVWGVGFYVWNLEFWNFRRRGGGGGGFRTDVTQTNCTQTNAIQTVSNSCEIDSQPLSITLSKYKSTMLNNERSSF